jgi:O-antigen/teichoic acid export membrane protein
VIADQMQKPKTLQARIVAGSVILLSGSGLTTAINLAYNIAVARFLGPKGFGHATAVYTILTLISAVTLSLQIICAKFVAQASSPEAKFAVYRGFHAGGWICGILIGTGLLLYQTAITNYLNLPSPVLVAMLAIGAAFYVPLGSRRGFTQGAHGFSRLAKNLVLEGSVRLGGSFLLILLGLGVKGVIAANAAAIAVAYLAIAPKAAASIRNPLALGYALRETLQALVFFSGQVLINNCDIVMVKHFFLPTAAGRYAAVAMVGRVIFAFSSAVVNSMFPLVAGTRDEERKDLRVIATSLLLVLGIGSVLALGLRLVPAGIWTACFGAGFSISGEYGLPYLLALYAITTVVYSLSVVIITYEMSYKITNTSWIQLAFSGVLIAGIYRFHDSLRQVVLVQLVLMVLLLLMVAIPFLIDSLTNAGKLGYDAASRPLRVIRRASEDEVIAEFLLSDFRNPFFQNNHGSLHDIVLKPNLDDTNQNATRRALFFVRHFALWKELPEQTEWYEVEISAEDLSRIRVFPRAQWRNLARGDFLINGIAERIRTRRNAIEGHFAEKITAIRDWLVQENVVGAVLLIGINENEALTVLDGNHRLVAAMLASPSTVQKLRFFCGLSPRMSECCWYNTNVVTLLRYGRHVLRYLVRNPEAELERFLQTTG